jgi:hypothetical protein
MVDIGRMNFEPKAINMTVHDNINTIDFKSLITSEQEKREA